MNKIKLEIDFTSGTGKDINTGKVYKLFLDKGGVFVKKLFRRIYLTPSIAIVK